MRDRTEDMERIKITGRETSSDLEDTRFYLLESRTKLKVRESVIRRSGRRDLGQKLRQVDEGKGVVREARERYQIQG